jgi:hypothetical protein
MGVEEAGRKKLALASIGFADVRVGAAVPEGAAGYKDGLLVLGLPVPKDDGLDAARWSPDGSQTDVSSKTPRWAAGGWSRTRKQGPARCGGHLGPGGRRERGEGMGIGWGRRGRRPASHGEEAAAAGGEERDLSC